MATYYINTNKKEVNEILKNEYNDFVIEWNKTHSISKVPSFTSWKKYYRKIS